MADQLVREVFAAKKNSLNAVRLLLAVSVIVSHSFAIGMYGPEPEAGGTRLGTWAVLGFFAISGFLITKSRLSGKPVARFYQDRVLRIFPGFLVCIVVVAFIFAPLSLAFDSQGRWSIWSSVTYFFRNLALYPPQLSQPDIAGTLQHVPYEGSWNGSLWTLFWEFTCYVFIGVAVSVAKRWLRPALLAVFVLSSVAALGTELGLHMPDIAVRVFPLVAAFSAGALIFLFQDWIKVNAFTVGVAVAALALATVFSVVQSLGALPLAFLVLWLGSTLPLSKIGASFDVSYGMYIYAWPVQQFMMLFFGQSLGVSGMIAASIAVTIPLAYLSCLFIENPAREHGRRLAAKFATSRPRTLESALR